MVMDFGGAKIRVASEYANSHFWLFLVFLGFNMNNQDLFEMSYRTRQAAFEVLQGLGIEETVRKMGGTMHIVGSLKTDLMMWNRDIDIHVYSGGDMLSWSFGLMAAITRNGAIKEFRFLNLLDTPEECIEWHITCITAGNVTWKLDLIHIRKGSRYDGYIEEVTDRIAARLRSPNPGSYTEYQIRPGYAK
jgi:hypothetical protein